VNDRNGEKHMTTTKKNDRTTQLTTFAGAVTAGFPPTQTWVFNNVTYKRDDLVSLAQGCIAATQSTAVAHEAWLAATHAEEAANAGLDPVLAAFKRSLESEYGAKSTKLTTYGFPAPKARVQSAASKAASAAKAKATRAAKKAALAAVAAAAPAAPATPVAGGSAPATGASAATPETTATPAGGGTPAKP
jgi:hypothetical protein